MNKQIDPLDAIKTSYNDTQKAQGCKRETINLFLFLLFLCMVGFILIRMMGV